MDRGYVELEEEERQMGQIQTQKMKYKEPPYNYDYERLQSNPVDRIYFFTGKDKKGIKVDNFTDSEEYIDEFMVSTIYEEAEWDDNLNVPGKIIRENVLEGPRKVRTFMVTEDEMATIKEILNQNIGEKLVYLDLREILKSLNIRYNEEIKDIVGKEENQYHSENDNMDIGSKFNK